MAGNGLLLSSSEYYLSVFVGEDRLMIFESVGHFQVILPRYEKLADLICAR